MHTDKNKFAKGEEIGCRTGSLGNLQGTALQDFQQLPIARRRDKLFERADRERFFRRRFDWHQADAAIGFRFVAEHLPRFGVRDSDSLLIVNGERFHSGNLPAHTELFKRDPDSTHSLAFLLSALV